MKQRPNKFSGTLRDSKAEPIRPDAEAAPEIRPSKTEREKGRSHLDNKAKYVSTTVYLARDVHKPVRAALLEDERDLSELVETLLSEWLTSRRDSKP